MGKSSRKIREQLIQGRIIDEKHYKQITLKQLQNIAKKREIEYKGLKKRELWLKLNSPSIDDILLSLTNLERKEHYTELAYNNQRFPVVEEGGIRFAVLPTCTEMYKALPANVDILKYLFKPQNGFPSFYTTKTVAESYSQTDDSKIARFRTTRPTKLFILNDVKNLAILARLFYDTEGVKGFLTPSRREAVRELFMITGLGIQCRAQEGFLDELEQELDLSYEDYKLNINFCNMIKDEPLKRMSLHAIDLQFVKNLCTVLKRFGCDGYIANEMPTAFGEISPVFHPEVALCFVKHVISKS